MTIPLSRFLQNLVNRTFCVKIRFLPGEKQVEFRGQEVKSVATASHDGTRKALLAVLQSLLDLEKRGVKRLLE